MKKYESILGAVMSFTIVSAILIVMSYFSAKSEAVIFSGTHLAHGVIWFFCYFVLLYFVGVAARLIVRLYKKRKNPLKGDRTCYLFTKM